MAPWLTLAAGLALVGVPRHPVAAQAPDAGAILDGAVAAFARVKTLRADFTQIVRDPMLGGSDTSWGEFLEQRPNKFAMRWRHPAGDLILSDGVAFWVYLPSSAPKQAVRSTLTGRPGESADLVAEFLDRPRQRFTASYVRSDSSGQRATDVLSLVPRLANVPYRRVQIWVDRADSLVRRVEINEGSGAVRRIVFDRLRANVPIPASSFVFRPPAGVRVVDGSH
jgi:outer membrane lipoprotein carrier protein